MGVQRIAVMKSICAENATGLAARLSLAATDPAVSVVVLHGADGIFCQGMDFSIPALEHEDASLRVADALEAFSGLLRDIVQLRKPVIAEVDGAALGGGVGLAAACDAVVASNRASFGLPEALFGLIPAVITPVLLRRMTAQKLCFLALSCHAIDAEQARMFGLVDTAVEASKLAGAVEGLARCFARASPDAVPVLKAFVGESVARPLAEMLFQGARMTGARLEKRSVKMAIRSFLDDISSWPAHGDWNRLPRSKGDTEDDT